MMGRMRRFTAVLAAVAAATVACAARRAPLPPKSPLVGTAAEIAAIDLRGTPVRIHDDVGKVRVVDVWATWCDPCRDQLPALDRLARAYGDRGVVVYAVSFDAERDAIDLFLSEHPLELPVLWDPGGETLTKPLLVTRLPTTYVLDRRGIVRFVHRGYGAGSDERLESEVRQLLGE
jgi:cytochrome c biogenesis protein CcmG/thiol:disulfide interchange protein DsbE